MTGQLVAFTIILIIATIQSVCDHRIQTTVAQNILLFLSVAQAKELFSKNVNFRGK